MSPAKNPESIRLADVKAGKTEWVRWGPYLSERQWGTVREDYSVDACPWEHLPRGCSAATPTGGDPCGPRSTTC